MKLRRTLLWVNGNQPDRLQEALRSEADCIVLELEDLVPPTQKEEARKGAVNALKNVDFRGKERIVRINHPDSEWGKEDMEAIFPLAPDAVRLPKCETTEYVLYIDRRLAETEREQGLPKNSIELILTLESPLGILNCYEMAVCTKRVTGIGLGAGDLTSAMGIDRSLDPDTVQLLYVKQKMVLAAKAAGVQVFDTTVIAPPGVSLDDFIEKDTRKDKEMGFTGRSVSMLPHVPVINRVYAPTREEYELSCRLVEGYNAALAAGQIADIFVEGHFLDVPVVEKARQVISFYEKLANKIS
ncbi:CoA ester lyase [Lacrimispora sp. NSJ-141]|uniref:CoA ester lyase n=1 Tax=Lientehia hominis TaxID=2897778 RepID=A0AAP2RH83_9FIRM|nr:CoA ester lyase [Lientehia hominis]MCD2492179.1 CoA ester lyase [Lientehia hominis]